MSNQKVENHQMQQSLSQLLDAIGNLVRSKNTTGQAATYLLQLNLLLSDPDFVADRKSTTATLFAYFYKVALESGVRGSKPVVNDSIGSAFFSFDSNPSVQIHDHYYSSLGPDSLEPLVPAELKAHEPLLNSYLCNDQFAPIKWVPITAQEDGLCARISSVSLCAPL